VELLGREETLAAGQRYADDLAQPQHLPHVLLALEVRQRLLEPGEVAGVDDRRQPRGHRVVVRLVDVGADREVRAEQVAGALEDRDVAPLVAWAIRPADRPEPDPQLGRPEPAL